MSKSTKPYTRVKNQYTGEVYEAVSSKNWLEKLTAWRAAMSECGHRVKDCRLPSPMPLGHIMFLRSAKRRPSTYIPIE